MEYEIPKLQVLIINHTEQTGKVRGVGVGGGVLILVKTCYFSEKLFRLCSDNRNANELLAVEVINSYKSKLLIIGAYRPDSDSLNTLNANLDYMLWSAYRQGYSEIIITGEFNTRNIHWVEKTVLSLDMTQTFIKLFYNLA